MSDLEKELSVSLLGMLCIGAIVLYQRVFSRDTGLLAYALGYQRQTCMYYPTCSDYMKEAIEKYGVFRGISLGIRRIVRCRPGKEPAVDPVP